MFRLSDLLSGFLAIGIGLQTGTISYLFYKVEECHKASEQDEQVWVMNLQQERVARSQQREVSERMRRETEERAAEMVLQQAQKSRQEIQDLRARLFKYEGKERGPMPRVVENKIVDPLFDSSLAR